MNEKNASGIEVAVKCDSTEIDVLMEKVKQLISLLEEVNESAAALKLNITVETRKEGERMKQIPENRQDIKELLYKQLALLAEKSEHCELAELCEVSRTMIEVSVALCSRV